MNNAWSQQKQVAGLNSRFAGVSKSKILKKIQEDAVPENTKKATKLGLIVSKVREDYTFRILQHIVHTTRATKNMLLTVKSLFVRHRQIWIPRIYRQQYQVLFNQEPPQIFRKTSLCKKTSSFHHSSAHIATPKFQVDPSPTALSIFISSKHKKIDSTVKTFCKQVFDSVCWFEWY